MTCCEFKGATRYYTSTVGASSVPNGAWYYPGPTAVYAALRDYIAVYRGRMEACLVDGERVHAQAGDFYGGWIAHESVGPFKGEPGTTGWRRQTAT